MSERQSNAVYITCNGHVQCVCCCN